MGLFGGNPTAAANLKINYDGKDAETGLQRLGGTLKTVISAIAIKQLAEYSTQLVKMGAEAERNEKIFRNMTTARNINADRMIAKMKEVTKGFVDNDKLMQLATKEFINNLSSDEIIAWMNLATNYARSVGQDIEQTLETTFQSLAAGNARAMKVMGVNFKVVNGEIKADLAELNKKAKELGDSLGGADSPLDAMARLNVQVKELGESVGKILAPAFMEVVGWAGKLVGLTEKYLDLTGKRDEILGKLFGGESVDKIQVDMLIEAAQKEKDFTKAREKRVELEDKLNKINQKIWETSKGIRTVNEGGKVREIKLSEKEVELGTKLLTVRRGELELLIQTIRQADREGRKLPGGPEKKIGGGGGIDIAAKAAKDNAQEIALWWIDRKQEIAAQEVNLEEKNQKELNRVIAQYSEYRAQQQEEYLRLTMTEEQKYIYEKSALYEDMYNAGVISYKEYLNKIEELGKESINRRIKDNIDFTNNVITSISGISSAAQSLSDALADREMRNLDKRKLSKRQYEREVARLEAEREERNRKFARLQQAILIARAISDAIAAGVGAAKDTWGGPIIRGIAMATTIAEAMLQVAAIQAQHFQRGFLGKTDRNLQPDNIPAMIGRNEAVIPGPQYAMHEEDVRAIVNNTANTAAGIHRMRGGMVVNNFVNPTTEQVLVAQKDAARRNRIGTKI